MCGADKMSDYFYSLTSIIAKYCNLEVVVSLVTELDDEENQ